MAITMNDVRAALDAEEPDYSRAVFLGKDALPFLATLVEGTDVLLAAKAAHLAARIGGNEGAHVVGLAARSHDPVVRVAAANAAASLDHERAVKVISSLVGDADSGVRRSVARTASLHAVAPSGAAARKLLETLSTHDPDAGVRKVTRDLLVRRQPRR